MVAVISGRLGARQRGHGVRGTRETCMPKALQMTPRKMVTYLEHGIIGTLLLCQMMLFQISPFPNPPPHR